MTYDSKRTIFRTAVGGLLICPDKDCATLLPYGLDEPRPTVCHACGARIPPPLSA
jgi:hypothetical protein